MIFTGVGVGGGVGGVGLEDVFVGPGYYISCADPEIFMRGGPTKMVIFGHRRGGVQPPKNPEITFFKVKFSNSRGGPDPRSPPPSGSAHVFLFFEIKTWGGGERAGRCFSRAWMFLF